MSAVESDIGVPCLKRQECRFWKRPRTLVLSSAGKVGTHSHVQPAERCPPDFADTLRAYKQRLLSLVELPSSWWIPRHSRRPSSSARMRSTRAALIEAGAEDWSIHTRAELQTLCVQNRVAPLTQAELAKLYEIRRTFNARITSND